MNERYKRLSHALRTGLIDGRQRSKLGFDEREACRIVGEFLKRLDRMHDNKFDALLVSVLRYELEQRKQARASSSKSRAAVGQRKGSDSE
jgi:hypothetical protein